MNQAEIVTAIEQYTNTEFGPVPIILDREGVEEYLLVKAEERGGKFEDRAQAVLQTVLIANGNACYVARDGIIYWPEYEQNIGDVALIHEHAHAWTDNTFTGFYRFKEALYDRLEEHEELWELFLYNTLSEGIAEHVSLGIGIAHGSEYARERNRLLQQRVQNYIPDAIKTLFMHEFEEIRQGNKCLHFLQAPTYAIGHGWVANMPEIVTGVDAAMNNLPSEIDELLERAR